MPMELRAIWSPNSYDGRRFVCGDQSGRTSAPINPHRVQTIREHSDRTGVRELEMPDTPRRIWRAVRDARNRE
jgi:hypothetical protein